MYIFSGIVFWLIVGFFLYACRLGWVMYSSTPDTAGKKEKVFIFTACAATILVTILPMSLSPSYNGEKITQRTQYEDMAEALLNGHIHLDYEVEPELLEMENPYDPALRDEQCPDARYDTAFYNGKYYMYFGITPAILIYLPYRIITGQPLLGYHGTQIIVAVLIIGMFCLFRLLSKLFFKKMSTGTYVIVSSALSVITVWYASAAPALYSVPIVSGIALLIWSFYLFVKAVWCNYSENKSIVLAFFGALLGALAFGCRPPVAIGNLLVVPMLIVYLKKYKISAKLILKLVFAAIPYFIIGGLLMTYNYARFENPFEFGQSYQLTTADQSKYMGMLDRFNIHDEIHGLIDYFVLSSHSITPVELGVFVFPVMLFIIVVIFNKKVIKKVYDDKMLAFSITLGVTAIIIASMDILWSPYFWARYRMDIYWLMCILAFIAVGYLVEVYENNKVLVISTVLSSFISVLICLIMFLDPYDHNYTFDYGYTMIEVLKHIVTFGLL